jgi:hypothetical protein
VRPLPVTKAVPMARWARHWLLLYVLAALAAPGAHHHAGPEFAAAPAAAGLQVTEGVASPSPSHAPGGDCLACQLLSQGAVPPAPPPAAAHAPRPPPPPPPPPGDGPRPRPSPPRRRRRGTGRPARRPPSPGPRPARRLT